MSTSKQHEPLAIHPHDEPRRADTCHSKESPGRQSTTGPHTGTPAQRCSADTGRERHAASVATPCGPTLTGRPQTCTPTTYPAPTPTADSHTARATPRTAPDAAEPDRTPGPANSDGDPQIKSSPPPLPPAAGSARSVYGSGEFAGPQKRRQKISVTTAPLPRQGASLSDVFSTRRPLARLWRSPRQLCASGRPGQQGLGGKNAPCRVWARCWPPFSGATCGPDSSSDPRW